MLRDGRRRACAECVPCSTPDTTGRTRTCELRHRSIAVPRGHPRRARTGRGARRCGSWSACRLHNGVRGAVLESRRCPRRPAGRSPPRPHHPRPDGPVSRHLPPPSATASTTSRDRLQLTPWPTRRRSKARLRLISTIAETPGHFEAPGLSETISSVYFIPRSSPMGVPVVCCLTIRSWVEIGVCVSCCGPFEVKIDKVRVFCFVARSVPRGARRGGRLGGLSRGAGRAPGAGVIDCAVTGARSGYNARLVGGFDHLLRSLRRDRTTCRTAMTTWTAGTRSRRGRESS